MIQLNLTLFIPVGQLPDSSCYPKRDPLQTDPRENPGKGSSSSKGIWTRLLPWIGKFRIKRNVTHEELAKARLIAAAEEKKTLMAEAKKKEVENLSGASSRVD